MKISKILVLALLLMITAIYSCKKSSPKPTPPPAPPPANLAAHWALNGNALDASRYGNNGTVMNTTPISDRFGNANSALYFDGLTSYIIVPDSVRLRLSNTDFTINAWVKLDSYSTDNVSTIISKRFAGADNGWLWAINGSGNVPAYQLGSVYFGPGGGELDATGTTQVSVGNWHMITGIYIYAAQTLTIYVDGVLDHTTSSIMSPNALEAAPLYIGMDTDGQSFGEYHFKGSLDEIRIYTTALDQASIKQLLNATN